jgi:polypeptide N-acetylgalactosaminyltransferase
LGNYEKEQPRREGAGEYGEGVYLKGEEVEQGKESVKTYGFNMVASDKISLDRVIKDTRNPE